MLKTLEEPPEYLKFILATTDPQKVPPTVLSRCLQFNLRPMAAATIAEHLASILVTENVETELAALKLIARAARGSMRDAQSLTDQAIAYGSGRVEEAGVRQMLGAVDRSHAVRCIEAAAARDGAALIAAVDGLRSLGLSAPGALEEMAALLQEMAVVQVVPDAVDAGDPEGEVVARLAALVPADETQLLYSIVLAGRAELELAPDEYSGLVMVLLRMLAFAPADERAAPTSTPTPTAASRSSVPRVAEAKVAPTVTAAAAAPAAAPVVVTRASTPPSPAAAAAVPVAAPATPVRESVPVEPVSSSVDAAVQGKAAADRWTALVQRLVEAGAIAAMVRELAMQAECVGVADAAADSTWYLRVERENLRAPALRDRLQAAATLAEGRPVRIEIESGAAVDTPAARDGAERERRQAEAERVIQDDPLVRALMAQYKTARIVPGSIKPH
jgi:DNA polymerase III subunit gamma/tau